MELAPVESTLTDSSMDEDGIQTPNPDTPPESKTPPTIRAERSTLGNGGRRTSLPRPGSESLDAGLLARKLKGHNSASRREATPVRSPSRKRQRIYGDRFIPNRDGQDLQASYNLLQGPGSPSSPSAARKRTPHGELHFQQTEEANRTYSMVLRNELMGDSVPQLHHDFSTSIHDPSRVTTTPPGVASAAALPPASITPTTPHKNLFSFMSPQKRIGPGHPTPSRTPHSRPSGHINLNANSDLYSTSPIRFSSRSILQQPRKQPRPVSKVPYKVLDAPELADDFYLNLVDWGSSDILGVGLGSCVYMWNATTGRVNKLCELPDNDVVTSVSWLQRGSHIAVGTHHGLVSIYDAERSRRLRTMKGHSARVGALAWNEHILTSGSRDRFIYHRDVRSPEQYCRRLGGHKQEVCGLRWNATDGQLASGGNDNKLLVWDKLSTQPLYRFNSHVAAVKAIAWSPHQHHLLASGGGTADRTIKFWNTATGAMVKEVDTGSQVCNLTWSKNSNELVSTHGYSQNQVVVWKYPRMEQVVSLTGHTHRVLYLSSSPDGTTVVTGAGDETLRFWKVFGKKGGRDAGAGSPAGGSRHGGDGNGGGGGGGGSNSLDMGDPASMIGGRLNDWGTIR